MNSDERVRDGLPVPVPVSVEPGAVPGEVTVWFEPRSEAEKAADRELHARALAALRAAPPAFPAST